MEKQIPFTLLTGFSLRDKSLLIKEMERNQSRKMVKVLYRSTNSKLCEKADDLFPLPAMIGEAVHDIEINRMEDLHTFLLENEIRNTFDEMVVDAFPFSAPILAEAWSSKLNYIKPKSHIHLVDAREFWFSYFSEHEIVVQPESNYTLGEALVHQLEAADTIVICHAESVSREQAGSLFSFIRNLQPQATVITFEEFFSFNENRKSASPIDEASSLFDDQIYLFESRSKIDMLGQYGIDAYVFKSKYAIELSKLERFFEHFPNEVFRMKGRCYNQRNEELYELSQIGASIRLHSFHMPSWSSDVLSEFLFIGEELDRNELEKKIEACLNVTVR